jgi:pilus assembly protein FimV
MPRLASRAFAPLALTVGLGAVSVLALGCSKKDAAPSTTTTTNGDSLTTSPSGAAPGAPGAPSPPGAMSGGPGAGGPGHGMGRHMQTFLDACSGKNANDACNVQLGARALTGTCNPLGGGPNQGQLSCRPTPGQFGPHSGAPGAPGAPGAAGMPGAPGAPGAPARAPNQQ